MMDAVVFGNVTLDVVCYPVDDVPRRDSIAFEQAVISPGGCGSNVAIGLCALGISTALVARLGGGEPGDLVQRYWQRIGLDTRYVRHNPHGPFAVSVGLVDHDYQPRFVHTTGSNALLTADDLDLDALVSEGTRALHVAGYFVLPGILDDRFPLALQKARALGVSTSLDVVNSPRMANPAPLWPCLPHLDYFLCNAHEASRLTGYSVPTDAAHALRERGAHTVIVKLGAEGCLVDTESQVLRVPAPNVPVVDTTGAGDAFAAGLVAALLNGADLPEACQQANEAGARMVGALGAVAGWL